MNSFRINNLKNSLQEFIIGRERLMKTLQTSHNPIDIRIRESLTVLQHILMSIIIHSQYLKGIHSQMNYSSNQHLLLMIKSIIISRVLELFPLNKRTSLNTTIPSSHFVNLNSIISTEVLNDITLVILFFVLWYNLTFISKHYLVISKHLIEVLFRSFHVQIKHILKSILFRSKTIIRRNRMINRCFSLFMKRHWLLCMM
jgi:hypothetical protein